MSIGINYAWGSYCVPPPPSERPAVSQARNQARPIAQRFNARRNDDAFMNSAAGQQLSSEYFRHVDTIRRLLSAYNYESYGLDFGRLPPGFSEAGWKRRYPAWSEAAGTRVLDRDMSVFQSIGLEVVRWFILADGIMYANPVRRQVSSNADRDDGPLPRMRYFSCTPTDLSPGFLEDFEEVLRTCRRFGVKLLPVLIDGQGFFTQGFRTRSTARDPRSGEEIDVFRDTIIEPLFTRIKGGHEECLSDVPMTGGSKLDVFLQRTLARLLEVSSGYRDSIFAWELINEPETCTVNGHVERKSLETQVMNNIVPQRNMEAFLTRGSAMIRRHGFRPSVGFQEVESLTGSPYWTRVVAQIEAQRGPRFLRQFHWYRGDSPFPAFGTTRAMVGEFASNPRKTIDNSRFSFASGRRIDRSIAQKFTYLQRQLGYTDLLFWNGTHQHFDWFWGTDAATAAQATGFNDIESDSLARLRSSAPTRIPDYTPDSRQLGPEFVG